MAHVMTAVRLPEEMRARIAAIAPGPRARSAAIREALDAWLTEQERKQESRENP